MSTVASGLCPLVLAAALAVCACSSSPTSPAPDGGNGDGGNGDGGSGGDGGCVGSDFMNSLGKTALMVGGSFATDSTSAATKAAWDVRYLYLAGGLFDGTGPCTDCRASTCTTGNGAALCDNAHGCAWWGCWQYDVPPPGEYVSGFASTAKTNHQIPMISYYELLQASGVAEGTQEVTSAANNVAFMSRYYADVRFLAQQIGSDAALIHLEPDFWGYAMHVNADPDQITAAVASANATDCSTQPNTITGMGRCLVSIVHKYAPNAKVGLHGSAWATGVDVSLNTSATLDVAAESAKLAAFLKKVGGDGMDFIAVDASDRDAGYYQQNGRNTWWDKTNATLPNFHQAFAWVKGLAEGTGKPVVFWQVPVGNESLPDTNNQYKDNRVDYFFAHTDELVAAHVAGIFFGAGAGGQTTPESDGSNFVNKAKAYYTAGGRAFCP